MASRSPRVVAVGDGIVDLVTPPMADFAPGDVQAEVPRFDPLPGGNATNFALQMASLGASTTFIGAVGSDSNARLLRDRYRQYGVRARLCVDPRRPTGSTMALTWSTEAGARHGPGGERAIEAPRRSGSGDSRSASSASVRLLVDKRARGETDGHAPRPRPPTRCDDLVGRVDGSSGVARSAD